MMRKNAIKKDVDSLYIVDETCAMFKHIIDFIRNCETINMYIFRL